MLTAIRIVAGLLLVIAVAVTFSTTNLVHSEQRPLKAYRVEGVKVRVGPPGWGGHDVYCGVLVASDGTPISISCDYKCVL